MGLDLYFIKRPAETTADTTRREQDEAVGYYRKFNALLNWIDANAGEVENCTDVPLTRQDLEKLRATLSNLTPETATTCSRPPKASSLVRRSTTTVTGLTWKT
ncbi:hypothetical protein [Salmonella enterica]|uniref:hypothetical protein n=1 Tax=Salmonella enterica TaxID=28901 RepID=UPI003632F230